MSAARAAGAARPRITGLGLVTPAGPNVPATCFALRAGLQLFAALPGFWVGGEEEGDSLPVMGAAVPRTLAVDPGLHPLASHARRALREALEDARLGPGGKVGLFLGHDPGYDPTHVAEVLGAELKGRARPALFPAGRCAVLVALEAALDQLDSGSLDAVIVGGLDSWVSPVGLGRLAQAEKLRSGDKPDGVTPGEAVGFAVLESRDAATARGARAYARVAGARSSREPTWGTEEPSAASALTRVLREALGLAAPRGGRERVPLMLSDHCGDRETSLEWSLAYSRAMRGLRGEVRHWHAADCIGDLGAGSGAVNLAWAATSLRERWVEDPEVLLWGVSDGPERAAALLLPEHRD